MAGNKYFRILLYPDDVSMQYARDLIESGEILCAWILHDRDYKRDDTGNIIELAKPHIHVLYKSQGQTSCSKVAELFQIAENYVKVANDYEAFLLYLVHYNNPDKAQYDVDEVHGFLKKKLINLLSDVIGGEAVASINLWLQDQKEIVTLNKLFSWICENNLYGYFRSNAYIFNKLREEHNSIILKSMDPDHAKVISSVLGNDIKVKVVD